MMVACIPTWLHQDRDASRKNPEIPDWFYQLQQQEWNKFLKIGLPNTRNERFKYADLSFLNHKKFMKVEHNNFDFLIDAIHQHRLRHAKSILLVLVNGQFVPGLSDVAKLPDAIKVYGLKEALVNAPELIQSFYALPHDAQKYPFAQLNKALCEDGLVIDLKEKYELSEPVHLLSLVTDDREFIAHPHYMVRLNEGSQLTIVEEHFSLVEAAYMMNPVMTTLVKARAQFTHYKIQHEGKNAIHLAHHFVHQMQDSQTKLMNFSFGALFSRDEMMINLFETRAQSKACGFYHLRRKNQYVDQHVDIEHRAPFSESEMIYKGIIDDQSRAVFNGRVYVDNQAQKIIAHQANHHLLLSTHAESYAKPELEIYADDVKCKHGATVGQIDQDALFYLCSRGIAQEEATEILLQGFAEEVLQRIALPAVKSRVQELGIAS